MARIRANSKKLIQIGDNTHNHGQAITLVSLRPTKRTVSNPVKPMPPEEEEEESLMIQNDGTAGVLGAAYTRLVSVETTL